MWNCKFTLSPKVINPSLVADPIATSLAKLLKKDLALLKLFSLMEPEASNTKTISRSSHPAKK